MKNKLHEKVVEGLVFVIQDLELKLRAETENSEKWADRFCDLLACLRDDCPHEGKAVFQFLETHEKKTISGSWQYEAFDFLSERFQL